MHGVVDSLEDAQDGGQRLLQVSSSLTALTVLQHLLYSDTQETLNLKEMAEGECAKTQLRVANLEEQLIFGDPLNRFQQVGIQAQFMLQLFLTLLVGKKTAGRKILA